MPTRFARTVLFFSSFFPLFAILAILSYKHGIFWSIGFLSIGLISLLTLKVYLQYMTRKVNPEIVEIQTFQHCGEEMLNYMLTYVFPFMVDFTQSMALLISFGIFFFVLAYLFVSNNMIHINPMLNFFGYHLYEITTPDGETHCLVSKTRPRRNLKMKVVQIGEQIYLEKNK